MIFCLLNLIILHIYCKEEQWLDRTVLVLSLTWDIYVSVPQVARWVPSTANLREGEMILSLLSFHTAPVWNLQMVFFGKGRLIVIIMRTPMKADGWKSLVEKCEGKKNKHSIGMKTLVSHFIHCDLIPQITNQITRLKSVCGEHKKISFVMFSTLCWWYGCGLE